MIGPVKGHQEHYWQELSAKAGCEGIAYQAEGYFLVSEERRGNIVRIKLPQSRSGSIKLEDSQIL